MSVSPEILITNYQKEDNGLKLLFHLPIDDFLKLNPL